MPYDDYQLLLPVYEESLKKYPDIGVEKHTPGQVRALLEAPGASPPDSIVEDLSKLVVVEDKKITENGVKLTIVRPVHGDDNVLPVILFLHGGGWMLGTYETYKWIVFELVVRSNAAVVFVHYSLSPEARHPVALEECYDALSWIVDTDSSSHQLDSNQIAVLGDSAGGHLSAALAVLDKKRSGDNSTRIKCQVLYYPATHAGCDTESYSKFGQGHFLTKDAMKYFWGHFIPNEKDRFESTASPLETPVEELTGVAPAFVVTAEADVLRDEGEAYARKLMRAGVPVVAVRALGAMHGFIGIDRTGDLVNSILDQTICYLTRQWNRKV
ncbi:alpha/beta hydrolase fold-domain-containing protein [Zychaea mexicana]|uniref:alpha/beta hydrolase fold-domain-containing protein n=1 Tax=Zychaea mexicana TaxID=64656 RepID=UPI0022FDE42E|nr:alpha/beta hydrolase fold-domain-containing protein [Zychaea mexicana]KAI9489074.1 alpha/beta hydrolase fold-domain-containing protein [Zychaea mexicana]